MARNNNTRSMNRAQAQPARRKRKGVKDVTSRQWKQVQAGLSRALEIIRSPLCFVPLILSIFLFYDDKLLTQLANTFSANAAFKWLGTFISEHKKQIAGLIFLVPATFLSCDPKWATIVSAVVSYLVSEVFPAPAKYFEYGFLGGSLILLCTARKPIQFVVATVVALLTIGLGLWGSEVFASLPSTSRQG
ncbi:hypothetical protein [Sarawak virus]|uniref:hypothetical protein n=1 Tax=Sarawak virus TaxID=2109380 RepID=UPI000D214109|nr:hypothetical protein [Sarawak virus]AVM80378.1 hypothetical protein [Sarawak virus]